MNRLRVMPVFPTCVGVFRAPEGHATGLRGLPHVRGGVSPEVLKDCETAESSPRAWGCF